ncbi:diacylglycerol kinase family protein [Microbacterium sp. NIBRBAC000506063]|uniref:diacylglycerol kinase family protein n=1 Tax=Microbacterium sp. NIBRBAC000506063 TaxID=2734618 RepID=UPI0039812B5F
MPLAVIPAGTGNDFAASHGIPSDLVEAADAVFDGRTITTDLARVTHDDGRVGHFATVLASGFDSKVNDRANRMTWPRGRARYNIAIAVEFALLAPIPFTVSWVDEHGDEGEVDGPLMLAAVGNTARYGGGIPICAGADPHDGLLDLTIVRPAGRARLVQVLAKAFAGTHGSRPEVSLRRVREVRLDAPGLTGYADGDALGPLPLTVTADPGALALRVPASRG